MRPAYDREKFPGEIPMVLSVLCEGGLFYDRDISKATGLDDRKTSLALGYLIQTGNCEFDIELVEENGAKTFLKKYRASEKGFEKMKSYVK